MHSQPVSPQCQGANTLDNKLYPTCSRHLLVDSSNIEQWEDRHYLIKDVQGCATSVQG